MIGDIVTADGGQKPWTVLPTTVPQLPSDVQARILQSATQAVAQAEMSGLDMSVADIAQLLRDARDSADAQLDEEARHRCKLLEHEMEDMLLEGGFYSALDDAIDDMTTYPAAFVKGPVIRRRGTLSWQDVGGGKFEPVVGEELTPLWERVDPMRIYPSKGARTVQDGYLLELHDLTIDALEELIGVPGYSDEAIRAVIEENATRPLSDWATTVSDRPDHDRVDQPRPDQTVEAVQFWGRVAGAMLIEWGLDAADVPDPAKSYDVEVWLVGSWAIKAVINADPLARRPYYSCSAVNVPGRVWGRSIYAMMRSCEAMCNAAARALDVNMGIASGPQVAVLVDRVPEGEEVTGMFPWKMWQFASDPTGANTAPISFFQPSSNASELMGVYDKFSVLADEYTGIPRYMTGLSDGAGGAGRTASGMSMMIGNASKTVRSWVAGIDHRLIAPVLEALHTYVMRYVDDPAIKGDVKIVARGALSLAVQEAASLRRNEFLRATTNPIDMQIVGLEGRAALLREIVKTLDMNPDAIVPPLSQLKARISAQQAQQQAMTNPADPEGAPAPDQTTLANGAPVTQNFDPGAER